MVRETLRKAVRKAVRKASGGEVAVLTLRARNAGGARVEIQSAILEVFPRLLPRERALRRSRELTWGEPDAYEAFPDRVPGLALVPGQIHTRHTPIALPRAWPEPLALRLEVRSGEDGWETENIARTGARVDNDQ